MTSDLDLTNHPDPAALRPAAMWLRYDSRADGWTPGRRAAFLTHLADNGVVAEAAAAVGKSLASAYALRRRAGGYSFNLGWEAALLLARRRVADELMTAAIKGETAVWTREEGKTTYTRFNPRTALALLDRVNPATSLNEVIVVAQHFDRFRDLIDEAADLWPLFDTGLHESDFDVRSRVRISLQLSDESTDFEGADMQDRLEPDDEDVTPLEYKSMPVGDGLYLGNCHLGNGGGSGPSAPPQHTPLKPTPILAGEPLPLKQMHIHIGVMAIARRRPPDGHEHTVGVATVDEDMAIAIAFWKRRAVSSAHDRFAAIVDHHRLAADHHDEFILSLMPVAL
jgi:hypothetical protein